MESSENCRSAGGHGNQHVGLRSAQINRIWMICPAPEGSPLLRAAAGARDPDFKTTASIPTLWLPSSAVSAVASSQRPPRFAWPSVVPLLKLLSFRRIKLRATVCKIGEIASRGLPLR